MLDAQRNPNTSYCLMWAGGLYVVKTYPKSPDPIAVASYRFDLLPQWLQEAVHLLDWAYPEEVKDLGRRVGRTYWIEAQDDVYVNSAKMLTTKNPGW